MLESLEQMFCVDADGLKVKAALISPLFCTPDLRLFGFVIPSSVVIATMS